MFIQEHCLLLGLIVAVPEHFHINFNDQRVLFFLIVWFKGWELELFANSAKDLLVAEAHSVARQRNLLGGACVDLVYLISRIVKLSLNERQLLGKG